MNVRNLVCLVTALCLAAPAVARSQSLPELAKLEKQRRARLRAAGGEAKLYTEGDSSGTKTESADPGAAAPADGSSAKAAPKKKEKTQDEVNAEKQKDWSGRVQKAQDEIKSLEDAITRNERALASMYNITPARADMANRIESDKKKLAELKQSLVSLEDERRRAGLARPR